MVESLVIWKADQDALAAKVMDFDATTKRIFQEQLTKFQDNQKKERIAKLMADYQAAPETVEFNDRPIYGLEQAEFTLIEFADLECPYCKRQHPESKKLVSRYSDVLNLQYRHFPLHQLHPGSIEKHRQSVCISQQSNRAFWMSIDQLYGSAMSANDIVRELDLDDQKFNECMKSKRTFNTLVEDKAMGTKLSINSTPVMYLLHKATGESVKVSGYNSAANLDKAFSQLRNRVAVASQ